MLATNTIWSESEREIARDAFNRAYDREISGLVEDIRLRANSIVEIEDLWGIHDLLSARRHQIEGKYDDRPDALMFVLAQLLKEKLLSIADLEGLDKDKLTKIAALSRM
jgi:hypothetical protein